MFLFIPVGMSKPHDLQISLFKENLLPIFWEKISGPQPGWWNHISVGQKLHEWISCSLCQLWNKYCKKRQKDRNREQINQTGVRGKKSVTNTRFNPINQLSEEAKSSLICFIYQLFQKGNGDRKISAVLMSTRRPRQLPMLWILYLSTVFHLIDSKARNIQYIYSWTRFW